MAKVVDHEAIKRRKWHLAKLRAKGEAERQKRMAEIFGDGFEKQRVTELAVLLKS